MSSSNPRMLNDDAIPAPSVIDEWSRKHTIEFCADQHDGHRCMLPKGHGGPHESLENIGRLRWEPHRTP